MTNHSADERAPQLGGDSAPTNNEPALSLDRLLPGLREAFESKNRGQRLTTIEQLRNSGSVQVVPLLIELMESSTDLQMRQRCVAMLGQLGDERALDSLIKFLDGSTDGRLRKLAVWGLGQIRSSRAIDPLVDSLKRESDLRVTSTIVGALGQIGDTHAIPALLALRENNTNSSLSVTLSSALRFISRNASLPPIIEMLYASEEVVRSWAMDQFASYRGQPRIELLDDLEKLLSYEHRADVRHQAIHFLGQLDTEHTRKSITSLLSHSDDRMRAAALEEIVSHRIPVTFDLLKSLVDKADKEDLRSILNAIGVQDNPDAVAFLLDQIEAEKWAWMPIEALSMSPYPGTPVMLLDRLDKATGEFRRRIITCLDDFNTPDVVSRLLSIVHESKDEDERCTALGSVDPLAYPTVIPDLLDILQDDPSQELRIDAVWILSRSLNDQVEAAFRRLITRNDDEIITATIVRAMLQDQISDSISLLREQLVRLTNEQALTNLVYALRQLDEEEQTTIMSRLYYAAQTPHLRCEIVEEASNLNPANILSLVVHALAHDQSTRVRWSAARTLAYFRYVSNDPMIFQHLIAALEDTAVIEWAPYDHENERVCDVAANALYHCDLPEAVSALAEWRRKNPGVKIGPELWEEPSPEDDPDPISP